MFNEELLKYAVNAVDYGKDIFYITDYPFYYMNLEYRYNLRKILTKLGVKTPDFVYHEEEYCTTELFYDIEKQLKELDVDHQITPEYIESVNKEFIKDLPDID